MILQICVSTWGVPESVNNTRGNYCVFDSLVHFRFEILCDIEVIPDRCRSVDEVLTAQQIEIIIEIFEDEKKIPS